MNRNFTIELCRSKIRPLKTTLMTWFCKDFFIFLNSSIDFSRTALKFKIKPMYKLLLAPGLTSSLDYFPVLCNGNKSTCLPLNDVVKLVLLNEKHLEVKGKILLALCWGWRGWVGRGSSQQWLRCGLLSSACWMSCTNLSLGDSLCSDFSPIKLASQNFLAVVHTTNILK